MATVAPTRMPLAEFLSWDDGTDRRYELAGGVALMVAPATEAHGELVVNPAAEIRSRLKPPCRVISEARLVIVARCASPLPLDALYAGLLDSRAAPTSDPAQPVGMVITGRRGSGPGAARLNRSISMVKVTFDGKSSLAIQNQSPS